MPLLVDSDVIQCEMMDIHSRCNLCPVGCKLKDQKGYAFAKYICNKAFPLPCDNVQLKPEIFTKMLVFIAFYLVYPWFNCCLVNACLKK